MKISEHVRVLEEENKRLQESIQFLSDCLYKSSKSHASLAEAFRRYIEHKTRKPEFGEWKIVILGLTMDAKTLGVDRSHLYRVLTGQRKSAVLMNRYRSLKKEQFTSNNNRPAVATAMAD